MHHFTQDLTFTCFHFSFSLYHYFIFFFLKISIIFLNHLIKIILIKIIIYKLINYLMKIRNIIPDFYSKMNLINGISWKSVIIGNALKSWEKLLLIISFRRNISIGSVMLKSLKSTNRNSNQPSYLLLAWLEIPHSFR